MTRHLGCTLLCLLVVALVSSACANPYKKNGFNLKKSLVPAEKILSGGPPKDGIPALTDPTMVSVFEADYLKPKDQVIGVDLNGEARAYPIRILIHHENVNGTVGGVPVAVTY